MIPMTLPPNNAPPTTLSFAMKLAYLPELQI